MTTEELHVLAREEALRSFETADGRASRDTPGKTVTAVGSGVAVHPDGYRVRVEAGRDGWAVRLLLAVRDSATLRLFGVTDGDSPTSSYLPARTTSDPGRESWRI